MYHDACWKLQRCLFHPLFSASCASVTKLSVFTVCRDKPKQISALVIQCLPIKHFVLQKFVDNQQCRQPCMTTLEKQEKNANRGGWSACQQRRQESSTRGELTCQSLSRRRGGILCLVTSGIEVRLLQICCEFWARQSCRETEAQQNAIRLPTEDRLTLFAPHLFRQGK